MMKSSQPKNSLKDFWLFLTNFKDILAWIAILATIAPLIDLLTQLGPPWPKPRQGIALLTSLIELFVLMYAFTFWRTQPKKNIKHVMQLSYGICILLLICYLTFIAFFTMESPLSGEIIVKGLVYQNDVEDFMHQTSAWTLSNMLEYLSPEQIWKPWSIKVMQTVLLITWLLFWTFLGIGIATFICLQRPNAHPRRKG